MSDEKQKRVGVSLAMTSNPCGESYVISAVAKGLVIAVTIDPNMWPPAMLAALLEHLAGAVRANGEQPKDTDRMTWAEKPRGDA